MVYTVKTGYALAKHEKKKPQRKSGKQEEYSTGPRKDNVWKGLWNLNIKHKHKYFLWKRLQGVLAIQECTFHKTKIGDPTCSCCGNEVETIEHLFFSCPNAPQAWKMAPL